MSDDGRLTVVCMRVERVPSAVEGSTMGFCEGCNCGVWMSPATQAQLEPMQLRVSCLECTQRELRGEAPEFGGFLPGQLEELEGL